MLPLRQGPAPCSTNPTRTTTACRSSLQELRGAAADRLDFDVSRDGKVNLAPYSQFNIVGFDPGYVMFAAGGKLGDGERKDSLVNAEETGAFVYNMATYDLRDAVSLTSDRFDFGIDEMKLAGLTPAPSVLVKPPRVAEAPISLECKYYTTLTCRAGRC